MPESLALLYQDDWLVAIDKPAGLLVHRSPLDRHETRFAVQLLRDRLGRHVWPTHRLDRGTSGILLFALDPDTARAIGGQFEAGTIEKRYLAVVRGHPPAEGEIDHPLSRQRDDAEWDGDAMSDAAQPALTRYTRLATCELPIAVDRYPSSRYALMALTPLTGRRHQLRRHMKHIAHPIIGDATHGKGVHNRFFAQHFHCPRLLLASTRLAFTHPVTGRRVDVKAPVSGCYADTLAQLGWRGLDQ